MSASVGKLRTFSGALLGRVAAACSERASAGLVERAGNVSLKQDSLSCARNIRIGDRDRGEKGLRVRMDGI